MLKWVNKDREQEVRSAFSEANGILQRFTETFEHKAHAGGSIEAGRQFVAAYVEKLHLDATGGTGHRGQPAARS